MIDSHCHLDLPEFKSDLDDVIMQSTKAGVERFLIPGTTPLGWQRQIAIREAYPQCDLAFGLHPYFLDDIADNAVERLHQFVDQHCKRCIAIGEIGLDATRTTSMEKQQQIFHAQLELAQQFRLPVILHHRKTHHLLIEAIKTTNFAHGGVIHAFSGSEQVAKQYIEMGFLLGIGGTITYSRANKTRQTVSAISLEHMLLETDSPDMPMQGRQGERNIPAYVTAVIEVLADLKKTTKEKIATQTTKNYLRLFSLAG